VVTVIERPTVTMGSNRTMSSSMRHWPLTLDDLERKHWGLKHSDRYYLCQMKSHQFEKLWELESWPVNTMKCKNVQLCETKMVASDNIKNTQEATTLSKKSPMRLRRLPLLLLYERCRWPIIRDTRIRSKETEWSYPIFGSDGLCFTRIIYLFYLFIYLL